MAWPSSDSICASPAASRARCSRRTPTALEMAEWADAKGFDMLVLSEHHGVARRVPALAAGARRAPSPPAPRASRSTSPRCSCPLHDPIRLAEDITALDLISNGRISIVAGLGYRPIEYAMVGDDWTRRGKLHGRVPRGHAQGVDAASRSSTTARPIRSRPRPVQQPHPPIFIGGSAPAAAKRAARFGFGLFPPTADSELVDIYHAECERLGKTPGHGRAAGRARHAVRRRGPRQAVGRDRRAPPARRHDLHVVAARGAELARQRRTPRPSRSCGPRASTRSSRPTSASRSAPSWARSAAFTHHPLCGGVPGRRRRGPASSCSSTRCCRACEPPLTGANPTRPDPTRTRSDRWRSIWRRWSTRRTPCWSPRSARTA